MAEARLGYLYLRGLGVPLEPAHGIELLRKSAVRGCPQADFGLWVCYRLGVGVNRDEGSALVYLRQAADRGGFPEAQYELGHELCAGIGMPRDEREGVRWIRKAAEKGYAKAQAALGSRFRSGRGVPVDEVEATFWFRKAADQGNTFAQTALGLMYESGRGGVTQSFAKAAQLYALAGAKGDANAQLLLASLYSKGEGIPPNPIECYKWSYLAARPGNTNSDPTCGQTQLRAAKICEELASSMTPESIAKAKALASKFVERQSSEKPTEQSSSLFYMGPAQ